MMQTIQAIAAGPLDHLVQEGGYLTAGIDDFSHYSRAGFRGRHADYYLKQRGFTLPDTANQAVWQDDGCLVARLSPTEYLLLSSDQQSSQRIAHQAQTWVLSELSCYLLPRQDTHACIALSGSFLPEMMAKLCAVDLSRDNFPAGAVVQTSVARASAIVINVTRSELPQFWLLTDTSMAAYFRDVLTDAVSEFSD
ncbi:MULTISPECIES: sarcosine oxidase subunit gamma family protein [Tatumella]|uniref:Sarcosine oxidase subunit gamma family protein n=1 Tax=Tatumella punctata TaxID=399969 RepID=A0ABW1VJK9_9GAMM|nr:MULTISPECIES: sarcosine oxidase subunit gamma family protein [unclassified Tatumella]MBS0855522.1 sarcosine oxidase [Tatumella sp. JGM16]MBS0877096.1 sarcosine oxidase [Tatumella sp. JGM82]MBS0890636.1 sarcosine oxidase [Tatumella sp. JGM94]MBS0893308.1 sarcosine oxidase [Tatumella sp. JGM130]MBS0901399.1 sarcosine oxidase [Tatumella sp. JGM100]